MELCPNFFSLLDHDLLIKIFSNLSEPEDIINVFQVCKFWHSAGIHGQLWRLCCIKHCPSLTQFSSISYPEKTDSSTPNEDSFIYSRICEQLARYKKKKVYSNCLSESLWASTTDNWPDEGIHMTLRSLSPFPVFESTSYWSSKGKTDSAVPETLLYLLNSPITLVYEIAIRPFQAYFQRIKPIYSAEKVRFRFGFHTKRFSYDKKETKLKCKDLNEYVWTYTSPVFRMHQVNSIQHFLLPKPQLCIGGIVLVELINRVQKQEYDDLFYICIDSVQIHGEPLYWFDFKPKTQTHELELEYLSTPKPYHVPDNENMNINDSDDDNCTTKKVVVNDYNSENKTPEAKNANDRMFDYDDVDDDDDDDDVDYSIIVKNEQWIRFVDDLRTVRDKEIRVEFTNGNVVGDPLHDYDDDDDGNGDGGDGLNFEDVVTREMLERVRNWGRNQSLPNNEVDDRQNVENHESEPPLHDGSEPQNVADQQNVAGERDELDLQNLGNRRIADTEQNMIDNEIVADHRDVATRQNVAGQQNVVGQRNVETLNSELNGSNPRVPAPHFDLRNNEAALEAFISANRLILGFRNDQLPPNLNLLHRGQEDMYPDIIEDENDHI